MRVDRRFFATPLLLLLLLLLALLAAVSAGLAAPAFAQEDYEWPNLNYDHIYYSELPGYLAGLEMSPRVKVTEVGTSAGGRPLWQMVISEPTAHGKYGKYQSLRKLMIRDPAKALEVIERDYDYKVPVFINCSIHGFETTGVDAGIWMAQKLAFENDDEVCKILENCIVVFNVVANPDGRIDGWRQNANGFDCNRDLITLSQPEARVIAKMYSTWKPMVSSDLHGFVKPILIEPCSMPHNPNYEEDIYLDWMLQQAEAQEARLAAEMPEDFPFAQIPYRDYEVEGGWDDYAPIYIPMFGLYYGLSAQTIETGPRDWRGVEGHFWSTWAAMLFAAENREEMFRSQIEIYRRGTNFGGPEGGEYPFAHIIPMGGLQKNPIEAAKTVEQLIGYEIQVKVAKKAFCYDGVWYPKGTYVVPLNQPFAGIANSLLSQGEDLTYDPGIPMYDIAAVSYPELWGFTRVIAEEPFAASLRNVKRGAYPAGTVKRPACTTFALLNDTNDAIVAVNKLLTDGCSVALLQTDVGCWPAGTFVVRAAGQSLLPLAKEYGLTFTGVAEPDAACLKELVPVKVAAFTRRTDLRATPADANAPNVPLDADGNPVWWGSLPRFWPDGTRINYGNSGTAGNATVGPMVFVLEQLGFDVTIVRDADILAGCLADYDVIVTGEGAPRDADAAALVGEFLAAGGGLVTTGSSGAGFAEAYGVVPSYEYLDSDSESNGIVHALLARGNPITGSYPEEDYLFDYFPAYFTDTTGLEVLATYPEDAFMSGFMPGYEAIDGQAAAVRNGNAVVFGNDPVFRAHIKNGFRMLSAAIFTVAP